MYSHVIIDSMQLYDEFKRRMQIAVSLGCITTIDPAIDRQSSIVRIADGTDMRITGMQQSGTLMCNQKTCRTALYHMTRTAETIVSYVVICARV